MENNELNCENPIVYLDINFGKAKGGRVIIELFKNVVPKTVENFRALCTGEKGLGKNGKPLHYKGTKFHRVVPICLVQGGDLVNFNGTGGESIYGEKFDDENFSIVHDKEGIVGMANNGKNSNHSQFYITTVPCPHLDGLNVAFGIVRKGLNLIVEMADIPNVNDKPLEDITIKNCGELKPNEQWNIGECDETEDVFPPWPNDWDVESNNEFIECAIHKIKDSGNYFFNQNNFIDSERKYKKALRYVDWYLSVSKHCNKEKIMKLKTNSLLNLAAVRLKNDKYKDVIEICTQVILKDSKNAKAYYRRALAKLALKDYDKALNDLNTAITLHPNDKNIQNLLTLAKKNKLTYLKKERRVFANLFK